MGKIWLAIEFYALCFALGVVANILVDLECFVLSRPFKPVLANELGLNIIFTYLSSSSVSLLGY